MKKKSRSQTALLIGRIFNIRAWSDWPRMKAFTFYLINGFKALFVIQQEKKTESFDKAIIELNLDEASLLKKQKALLRLSKIMVFSAALILGYAAYQLCLGSFRAFLISLIVMFISLTLAFRYHFWYFQIKEHILGCTFRQWFRQGLLGEQNE